MDVAERNDASPSATSAYDASLDHGQTPVVIKEYASEVQIEAKLGPALQCKSTVSFKGVVKWSSSRVGLIMRKYTGSLEGFVRQFYPKGIPQAAALELMSHLARAVVEFHEEAGCRHLNLKPSNVLMDYSYSPLNQAPVIDSPPVLSDWAEPRLKSLLYSSPEQIRNAEIFGTTDVFSLGLVFHFILTGRSPWEGRSDMDILNALMYSRNPPPVASSDCPAPFRGLLQSMTLIDPAARPSLRQVLSILSSTTPSLDKSAASPFPAPSRAFRSDAELSAVPGLIHVPAIFPPPAAPVTPDRGPSSSGSMRSSSGRYGGGGGLEIAPTLSPDDAEVLAMAIFDGNWDLATSFFAREHFQPVQLRPYLAPVLSVAEANVRLVNSCHLHWNQDPKVIQLLVQGAGADVNATDNYGKTALFIACSYSNLLVAKVLIELGAAIDLETRFGARPLRAAAYSGCLPLVRMLLSMGAQVDARLPADKTTAFFVACEQGHVDVARALWEAGGNAAVQSKTGSTPLHVAVKHGRLDVTVFLVSEAKVSVEMRDADGVLPWKVRREKRAHARMYKSCVAYVKRHRPKSAGWCMAEPNVDNEDKEHLM